MAAGLALRGGDAVKFSSALLAVSSITRSREFYTAVLGQHVIYDFGENVAFEGFCLQDKKLWADFLQVSPDAVVFGGNDAELYFETEEFDAFLIRLKESGAALVAPPLEHNWGQRVVRFYDPDRHIVEVGEAIAQVCRRFLAAGMTMEETAAKSQMPVSFVQECMQQ